MTQLILYTSEGGRAQVQRKATAEDSSVVQTRGTNEASVYAAADHFRGVTKLIGLGHNWRVVA